MKIYVDCWYSSSLFKLGIRWRWVVSFMPQPLYSQGNQPPAPTEQDGGWAPGIGLEEFKFITKNKCFIFF
jgi:hypothetical protein